MKPIVLRVCCVVALLVVQAASARAADEGDDSFVPFVIPAVPDASSMTAFPPSRPIAADAPRVAARDAHFYLGNDRIKFWAVNLTFGADFPAHAHAEHLVDRLSQAGVNAVRLHHMDMLGWGDEGRGIWDAKDPKKLSPEALDRLDYLIGRLARAGIYVDLNLHVGRTHSKEVGLPEVPGLSFDKMIDIFTPQLVDAQKDYARQLLTHVNAYRRVRYADDPAIAVVEINNEDSLFMWGSREHLETLPEPYSGILRSQFAAWLTRKYGSTEKLRDAWDRDAEPLGENLIADGAVPLVPGGGGGGDPHAWWLEVHEGNAAKVAPAADEKAARVEIAQADGTGWHIQFQQRGLTLRADRYYTVQFTARADAPRTIAYTVNQAHEPWQTLGLNGSAKLTPQWKTFRAGFVAAGDDDRSRLSFSVGGEAVSVELKDVSLRPGGREGLVQGESLEAGNVALFGTGQTAARATDTWTFLAQTEKRYYDGMRDFVKKEIGCGAMVTGTIVFGPLGLYAQSDMDFIDGHAYWHHPEFPGRPWDMNNWTVEQTAMADHPEQATLFQLAWERLAGKPFTVTEYNHSAPNDAQAETVPEAGSFAAAQDWDGIWFFDYGTVPNADRFTDFFDVGSNPAKWGMMSAGAAVYRGGGIAPLAAAKVVPLSSGGDDMPARLASLQQKHDLDMAGAVAEAGGPRWRDLLGTRVYVALGPGAQAPPAPEGTRTSSALHWDTSDGKGTYEATGPGALVWVGHADPQAEQSTVKLLRPEFAAITLVTADGTPFAGCRKVLVAACGRAENVGMQFSADRRTVGTHLGKGPVGIQPVEGRVRFPSRMPAGRWLAYRLGPDGRPTGAPREIHVEPGGEFHLDVNDKTMWYVLTRE